MSYLESAGFTTIKPVNGDKYDIVGAESQLVNIKLAEGETLKVGFLNVRHGTTNNRPTSELNHHSTPSASLGLS